MFAPCADQHPTPEQLTAFAHQTLNDEEWATVEEHVNACESCRQILEALPEDPFVAMVRGAAVAMCSSDAPPCLHAGYEILEQIGQGGMGAVFKARQAGLGRLVALKRLHAGARPKPEALSRFRREAEAVARLDHTNIVRIYEVGEQDGQPYLALEYVAGGTLKECLAGNPLVPTAAAALVATLARAIDHAHQQGIVHRDLKPANILLQNILTTKDTEDHRGKSTDFLPLRSSVSSVVKHCTPKITDFGLAKLVDQEQVQTQTGDILGTPGYMAPEQATGHSHAVGPAADIYALGAILYEALTGRPPFQGATMLDTLEQVRKQEPVPPARLQPKVPRDLDTVCLKCLEKAPRQRYATAGALAEDLQRVLDGKPTLARPVPAWEKAWKWARRRPAVAGLITLSGLAFLALIAGLWLHTKSLNEQVRRAETGEAMARRQKQRADTNYQQARQAINGILDRLDKFYVAGVPRIESLRRELRADALAFFNGVAKADTDGDPATRLDVAQAYRIMGTLQLQSGQLETSRQTLERARVLLEKLVADCPNNREYQAELGRCYDRLGHATSSCRLDAESLAFREQALAICQELCRLEPDNATWQRDRASRHNNLGVYYYDRGRLDQVEPHWQKVIRMREKLVQEHPGEVVERYFLAISYANLATLYRDTGRKSEADARYGKCEPLLTELVRDHPEEKHWAVALAQTLRNWGCLLNDAHRPEDARQRLTRAVEIMEQWLREDPLSPEGQDLLLGCLVARMHNCTLLQLGTDGERDWQRAWKLSAQRNSWDDLCIGVLCDARFGAHGLAAARAKQLEQQPGFTSANRFQLAKVYAQAAEAAHRDKQLSPVEQERQAEHYTAAALGLLAQLSQDGYFKDAASVTRLKTDSDLKPLHQRAAYQELLTRLVNPSP
jgi:serine/threonine protein kinase/tetratricopeptide (TPR) repeat protein